MSKLNSENAENVNVEKQNGKGSSAKKGKESNSVFTKETFGVVIVLFTTLCLICLITGDGVFSVPGKLVKDFLMGVFGYFSYLFSVWMLTLGVRLIIGKKFGLTFKRKALLVAIAASAACFAHVLSLGGKTVSYGEYLARSYSLGESVYSAGGVITGVYAYFFTSLLTVVGSTVVTGVLFAIFVYFLIAGIVKDGNERVPERGFKSSYIKNDDERADDSEKEITDNDGNAAAGKDANRKRQRLFINDGDGFGYKTRREIAKDEGESLEVDSTANALNVSGFKPSFSESGNAEMQKKIEYIKTPVKLNMEDIRPIQSARSASTSTTVSDYINPRNERTVENLSARASDNSSEEIPMIEHDVTVNETAESRAKNFGDRYVNDSDADNVKTAEENDFSANTESFDVAPESSDNNDNINSDGYADAGETVAEAESVEEEIAEETASEIKAPEESEPPVSRLRERNARRIFFDDEQKTAFDSRAAADGNAIVSRRRVFDESPAEMPAEEVAQGSESKPEKVAPPINREYFRPPLDLLETRLPSPDAPKEDHDERIETIKRVLEEFHINVEPQGYVQGPTITRYEVKMPAGVTVKRVLAYDDDLKMRLQSKAGVRIEAPIPGKDLVGIEVANKNKVAVGLKEVLEGAAGQKEKSGALIFAIGKDIVGKSITDNLAKGPHYLVAGATGSGKSVCLNVMIVSMLMRYSPEELRLILIDPKRVGFRKYEHLPHLMIDEIITEPQKAVSVLKWAYNEMERRYGEFEKIEGGLVSDIESYNELVASDTVAKMPRIVIVVDELADLMETCKRDMEAQIRMLAQKARAAGIHLVLATQRPSVDVVTGTIKANLPSRIALKVMNYADSSTILSEGGAEKLLGNGDMLYKNSGMSEPERYQGAWISDREINNVVTYIKERNACYFDDGLKEFLERSERPQQDETAVADGGDEENVFDDFFLKALWLAVTSNSVSIAQLQRRFQIGYARAGGLVDKMERLGFVSPNEGSKARRVLITREEFEERFGSMPDNY